MAGCDLVELVVRLVEREQAADAEQHDRDDERVDVTLTAVAEGVGVGRLPPGAPASDEQQCLVAGIGHRVNGLGQHRR